MCHKFLSNVWEETDPHIELFMEHSLLQKKEGTKTCILLFRYG